MGVVEMTLDPSPGSTPNQLRDEDKSLNVSGPQTPIDTDLSSLSSTALRYIK